MQHRLFPGFAGVMLADILANSVAMLIIMITITMSVIHEAEKEKLEQVEDISVVLSRNIARSVVMNALPTSAPAMLHDYHNSPLDANPRHSVMPIIELHTDHVRNRYTGATIHRDELLRNDNRFDRYLRSLHRLQRESIRIDIYSIRLFYIVMSIIKEYGPGPRHWHFIGYGQGGQADARQGGEERPWTADGEDGEDGEGEGRENGGANDEGALGEGERMGGEATQDALGDLPSELDVQAGADDPNYPIDALAMTGSQAGEEETLMSDLPGQGEEGEQNETARASDEMLEALREAFQGSQAATGERPQTARFRTAMPGGEETPQDAQGMQLQLPHFRAILPALFEFMRRAQEEADAGGRSLLVDFNFMRDLLPLLNTPTPPALAPLFDKIGALFDAAPDAAADTLFLRQETGDYPANVVTLEVNTRLKEGTLAGDRHQARREELPGNVELHSRMSLYPEIYRGLQTPIREDALLLMPPEQRQPQDFRWRVVALVSPLVDDFLTAFVYAAIGENGELLLAADENAVQIDGSYAPTRYPPQPHRNEYWTFILYGVLAALLLAAGFAVTRRAK